MSDKQAKGPGHADTGRAGKGDTVTVQGETQEPRPRMPHERDASADSQAPAGAQAREMGRLAHDAAVAPQQDTGKGPAMDAAYAQQKDGAGKKRRQ